MTTVQQIGVGFGLWCAFSVPAALIVGNVLRKCGDPLHDLSDKQADFASLDGGVEFEIGGSAHANHISEKAL